MGLVLREIIGVRCLWVVTGICMISMTAQEERAVGRGAALMLDWRTFACMFVLFVCHEVS